MRYESDEMEIDLRELLYVIRKKFLVICLVAVLFAGAVGAYSFFVADPVYKATARLYIQTQSTSITSLADIQIGESLARDYVELIQSRTLIEEVIKNLEMKEDYKTIKERLSVDNPEDTRILNINIEGTNAKETAILANEFARVAQKQISEVMNIDEPALWETAITPENPIKPEKAKNTVLGFIIGGFLAALVVVVLHLMDDAIKSPDDVERYLGLNNLGSIPYEGGKRKKHKHHRHGGKRKKKNKAGE